MTANHMFVGRCPELQLEPPPPQLTFRIWGFELQTHCLLVSVMLRWIETLMGKITQSLMRHHPEKTRLKFRELEKVIISSTLWYPSPGEL